MTHVLLILFMTRYITKVDVPNLVSYLNSSALHLSRMWLGVAPIMDTVNLGGISVLKT